MTTIITGANRGLGYGTARALAADPARTLVLVGRDLPSLTQAVERIQSQTGNAHLVPMQLDLASLASVRQFMSEFRARNLPPLRAIVCNAGVSKLTAHERSVDGYEITFAVNHLGHFLLVHLLLDCLEPPARIIFVSSGTHDPDKVRGPMQAPRYVKAEWLAYPERDPGLDLEDSEVGGRLYASSKLCNVLCTYELARRLESNGLSTPESPITVNSFAPGLIAGTGLGRDARGLSRFMWYWVLPLVSRFIPGARSVAQSGADLAYLATDPAIEGVTGKYFREREIVESSAASYDLDKAADLWRTSVELSHLQPHESPLLRSEPLT